MPNMIRATVTFHDGSRATFDFLDYLVDYRTEDLPDGPHNGTVLDLSKVAHIRLEPITFVDAPAGTLMGLPIVESAEPTKPPLREDIKLGTFADYRPGMIP